MDQKILRMFNQACALFRAHTKATLIARVAFLFLLRAWCCLQTTSSIASGLKPLYIHHIHVFPADHQEGFVVERSPCCTSRSLTSDKCTSGNDDHG